MCEPSSVVHSSVSESGGQHRPWPLGSQRVD